MATAIAVQEMAVNQKCRLLFFRTAARGLLRHDSI